jgi:hypothetical protein
MLIAEYSYEEDMQVKLQEGIWQGRREVLGGELRETQTANYFSNFSPVDCAVPSANA